MMKSKIIIKTNRYVLTIGKKIKIKDRKMRVCAYEVVEELPFDAAQKNDVLSDGPSVRTGFVPIVERPLTKTSSRFSGCLEYVFDDISEEECETLCDQLGMDMIYGAELLDELLVDYTYTEIRQLLNEYL